MGRILREMHVKQAAGFFLVCFLIVAVLGILSFIAIPNVGRMIAESAAEDRAADLFKVQTAVTEMLYQSICGTLEPVSPTSDMSQVRTRDIYPLVLSDYLVGVTLESGCLYSLTADGTVIQTVP
jgi:Tfp pilus assembly protein PilE